MVSSLGLLKHFLFIAWVVAVFLSLPCFHFVPDFPLSLLTAQSRPKHWQSQSPYL